MSARYALYFAPEPSFSLWSIGSAILGRDAVTGAMLAHPDALATLLFDWHAASAEPRRYGFHATLKAPFRLADGTDEAALVEALEVFAAECTSFTLAPLTLAAIGGEKAFLALVETEPSPHLGALAGDIVRAFDRFRAPLTQAELDRRLASPLSDRQRDNLARWGYPHVFADFKFHMTLSDRLDHAAQALALPALESLVAPHLADIVIDAIALFMQPAPGAPFTICHRAAFQDSVRL